MAYQLLRARNRGKGRSRQPSCGGEPARGPGQRDYSSLCGDKKDHQIKPAFTSHLGLLLIHHLRSQN